MPVTERHMYSDKDTSELLARVRKIEIKTRGLTRQVFSGQYHSAFRGRGMAFSEVREYQYGDDIRSIDWNVTARFHHPYVKVFDEERELSVILLVDVSASHEFGAMGREKQEVMTEVAAVLAFSAISNHDKVGVIFFSDRIEKFIPPKKGSTHILRIIRELLHFRPQSRGTNIAAGLKYLQSAIRKRSVAFVLSDFMDEGFADALSIVSRKHDLACIRINDPRESDIPPLGLMRIQDAESGACFWADTNASSFQQAFHNWKKQHEAYLANAFTRAGTDNTIILTDRDYVPPLIRLFRQRSNMG